MGDLDLVRLYWPDEARGLFDAVMGIDGAMADVVLTSSQPALGAIRLAWWREACERLDRADPPAEPRLTAAATLVPHRLPGADLGALESGWSALLDEEIDPDAVGRGGARLFGMLARLLDSADPRLDDAGRLFALVRAARLGHPAMIEPARELAGKLAGHRFTRSVRPVTALARLAARDLKAWPAAEPPATPARAVSLLSHRLFGAIA